MATDFCLPLLKYSHATGTNPDHTIPWNHLQASDIFVIVTGKITHIADGQLTLRVVQGNRVLESIDVAQYVEAALEARRGAEQHGVTPQVEQLPIFGITKEAILALRYRPADGQTRRLQLRMQNATHCRQMVDAFVRRGMEFQDQRPGRGRKSIVRPTSAVNLDRLLTATSSSPHFQQNPPSTHSGLISTAASEIGSLPRLPSARPVQALSISAVPAEYIPAVQAQVMPPPQFLSRGEAAAPGEVAPTRPSTSQIYRSYTTPSQPSPYEAQEVLRRPSDPNGERPSSTSHMATLATIREAVEAEATPPRTATDMPPPALQPTLSIGNWSSSTPEPAALTALLSDGRPYTARPSTSGTSILPETFDHDIQPPRELPFKRPDSKRGGSAHSSSRPGTSAMSLPPLPKPKLRNEGSSSSSVQAESLSPEKAFVASRPGTASPLKRGFNTVDANVAVERAQTSMGLGSAAHALTTSDTSPTKKARGAEPIAPDTTSIRKPSGMQELLSRRPLGDRSTNARIPRMNSLADAPHEIVSPPPKTLTARDPTLNAYNLAMQTPLPRAAEAGEVSLGEYATQSRQDREAVLEAFMMEKLEDPAFATLCEDVENCWRMRVLWGCDANTA